MRPPIPGTSFLLVALFFGRGDGFVTSLNVASRIISKVLGGGGRGLGRATVPPRASKKEAPEKPEIKQDVDPRWYILNVATGKELTCKKLLDLKLEKFGFETEVLDILVPTQVSPVFRRRRKVEVVMGKEGAAGRGVLLRTACHPSYSEC